MTRSIRLTISADAAERIQLGLADAACWMREYMAGNSNLDQHPLGLEAIREMNTLLKRAQDRTEKDEKVIRETAFDKDSSQ